MHKIFSKPYHKWWIGMALLSIVRFAIFGFPNISAYKNYAYGYGFYTIAMLFTYLVFGSALYLVYWLIFRKWNNDIFIKLIAFTCGALLILL